MSDTTKWEYDEHHRIIGPDDKVIAYASPDYGPLMATAPEMLAMLEKIAAAIVTPSWVRDEIGPLIAKAKGEA